jgi:chaperonin GroEL
MQFDQGYLSPYFMTNVERQLVEFDNPVIFLYDGKVNSLQSILPLLEEVQGSGRPLVIIADEVDNEPLAAMVLNHTRGVLKSCAVKAPGYGDIRKFTMEDIAILTGGEFISTSFGKKLDQLDASVLGSCDKIKVTPTETIIIGGHGDPEKLQERIDSISAEIQNVESSYDKEKLQERLAKLTGGVAVIKVGGATEVEVKELKDRVDDAICATKAALEEGVLPGGGIALLRSRNSIDYVGNPDEAMGMQIVCNALEKPLKTIVENAGKSGDMIVEKVLESNEYNYGYDARNNAYGDMVEKGIIDATKVVRCSLENGASIAGQLITVESLIIDDVDENLKMIKGISQAQQMM